MMVSLNAVAVEDRFRMWWGDEGVFLKLICGESRLLLAAGVMRIQL